MNKKQLIVAWVISMLLLSGCATIATRSCPKDSVFVRCGKCNSDFCAPPYIPEVTCFYCGAKMGTISAIKEYTAAQERMEAQRQVYGGLCEKCGRQFNFNKEQWDNYAQIICPYCGLAQDLKMASNRYQYLQQQQEQERKQQQALATQMAINNFFQSNKRNIEQSAQIQQQYYENIGNAYLNLRGLTSAPSYQYIPSSTPPSSYKQKDVHWQQVDPYTWYSSDGHQCVSDGSGGLHCR